MLRRVIDILLAFQIILGILIFICGTSVSSVENKEHRIHNLSLTIASIAAMTVTFL